MRYQLMIAVASAALLVTSGAAMADQNHAINGSGQTSVNGDITNRVNGEHPISRSNIGQQQGSPETEMHHFGKSANGNYQANENEGQNESMGPEQQRMAALIGRPVVNSEGQQIGNVVQTTPDGLVVSTGQYLGMGQHEVLIRSSDIRTHQGKEGPVVSTTLSRDQLSDLPTYHAQPTRNPNALYNVPADQRH